MMNFFSIRLVSRWKRCSMVPAILTAVIVSSFSARSAQAQSGEPVTVTIDAAGPAHPFPHFWEQMFGSGRAILSLRESYRHDLKEVKGVTDFEYIRFHAIFHDEVGVYDDDKD